MKQILLVVAAATCVLLTYGLFAQLFNTEQKLVVDQPKNVSIQWLDTDHNQGQYELLEANIQALIGAPQTCQNNSDCDIHRLGCPFGCDTLLNRENHTAIVDLQSQRDQACNSTCQYRCLQQWPDEFAVCHDNICQLRITDSRSLDIQEFKNNNHPLKQQQ